MLTTLLVAVAVIAYAALANGNRCANKADIELYDKIDNSKFSCWPVPNCNDGQEASVEPGSSHPQGTKIQCVPCPKDFFSNNGTNKRCRLCTPCGNKKELLSCEHSRDRQCSNSCISSNYYFNATDQQCHPCTECCGDNDDIIEPQCISIIPGTVIGGRGEKHCKALLESSKQCSSEQQKRNLSSSLCGNSSASNKPHFVEEECSCSAIDGLHIALICVLAVLVLALFLSWFVSRRKRRSSRSDYSPMPCVCSCFSASSPCEGQRCDFEIAPCLPSCQEKLKSIPDEIKIDDIKPYQVESLLIEKLDGKRARAKNWWDVGRMLGFSVSQLENVKQEENREGGSPTRCLLGILSTWADVVSLKKFMETIHNLGRHDICNPVCECYQSQDSAV